MNGLMTEREWRRQALRRKKRSVNWGAQYVLPKRHPLLDDRAFQLFLLLLSAIVSLAMPFFAPVRAQETFAQLEADTQQDTSQPRQIGAISYCFPQSVTGEMHIFTRQQLLAGRMMLLDEAHPLPPDAPAPNTMSIALRAHGSVPVRDLHIASGLDTIDALAEWFTALRKQGISGLMVWEGTLSTAQQRTQQVMLARALMANHTPDEAAAQVYEAKDAPGTGDLLQPYTVEIRLQADGMRNADLRPLEQTQQGQQLLHTAWRYGFVRIGSTGVNAYRFRYVGRAHAAAMTYLDLSLRDYLQWMQQKGVLTIREAGTPKYMIICKPASGSHVELRLPQGADYEISMDNMGYAIAACTLP